MIIIIVQPYVIQHIFTYEFFFFYFLLPYMVRFFFLL